jgi:hypothetical protein
MNLDITLSAPAECSVEVSLYKDEVLLDSKYSIFGSGEEKIHFEQDFVPGETYRLEIGRHEEDLYYTDRTFHEHFIKVVSVVLDDFWKLTDNQTHYDREYVDFVECRATWELANDRFNDVLHFNGSLLYNITTPVRGMFFK